MTDIRDGCLVGSNVPWTLSGVSLRSSSPFDVEIRRDDSRPRNVTFIKGSCKYLSRRKQYSSLFPKLCKFMRDTEWKVRGEEGVGLGLKKINIEIPRGGSGREIRS